MSKKTNPKKPSPRDNLYFVVVNPGGNLTTWDQFNTTDEAINKAKLMAESPDGYGLETKSIFIFNGFHSHTVEAQGPKVTEHMGKKAKLPPHPRDFFGNPIRAGDVIAVRQNVGQFQTMGRRRVVEVHAGPSESDCHIVHEHMDGGKPKRLLKTRACFVDMNVRSTHALQER